MSTLIRIDPTNARPKTRLFLVATAVWAIAAPLSLAATPSHCLDAEQNLFSCTTGRNLVSVCGSADLSGSAGWLQYRFGPPGAPQLSQPARDAAWRERVSAGTVMYSGGGGAYLMFHNPPYRTTVYSADGRGWGHKAGVVVDKQDKRLANLRCRQAETSELGPDLFERAQIPAARSGFLLP